MLSCQFSPTGSRTLNVGISGHTGSEGTVAQPLELSSQAVINSPKGFSLLPYGIVRCPLLFLLDLSGLTSRILGDLTYLILARIGPGGVAVPPDPGYGAPRQRSHCSVCPQVQPHLRPVLM